MNKFRPIVRYPTPFIREALEYTLNDMVNANKHTINHHRKYFTVYERYMEVEDIEKVSEETGISVSWLNQSLRRVEAMLGRYEKMKERGVL